MTNFDKGERKQPETPNVHQVFDEAMRRQGASIESVHTEVDGLYVEGKRTPQRVGFKFSTLVIITSILLVAEAVFILMTAFLAPVWIIAAFLFPIGSTLVVGSIDDGRVMYGNQTEMRWVIDLLDSKWSDSLDSLKRKTLYFGDEKRARKVATRMLETEREKRARKAAQEAAEASEVAYFRIPPL